MKFNEEFAHLCRTLRNNIYYRLHPYDRIRSPYIEYTRTCSNPPDIDSPALNDKLVHLENQIFITNTNDNPSRPYRELCSIKAIKDIKFTKADKGGCLTILNYSDYDRLVRSHLNDTLTYNVIKTAENMDILDKIRQLANS